ncbi:hypothetical protein GCM10010357_66850 [Streptomyces luteireticuli]|uniref:Tetratricopeptide repeat protein n=1 Tax=Streptomyces luteireticuli TaxID=173858 RepID=A0ABN0Z6H2_9ACTN
MSPFDEASLTSESALVARDMGAYGKAIEYAEQAIRMRAEGRARSLALSRVTLVSIDVCREDLDAVVESGEDLLTPNPALGSVRVVNQVVGLRRQLKPHAGYRPVQGFLSRLDEFARTQSLLLADLMPSRSKGSPK